MEDQLGTRVAALGVDVVGCRVIGMVVALGRVVREDVEGSRRGEIGVVLCQEAEELPVGPLLEDGEFRLDHSRRTTKIWG